MDDSSISAPASPPAASSNKAAAGRAIRVGPIVLLLAAFWVFLYANYHSEMDMSTRFFTRMVAMGILLLAFLAWWLTRRGIRWRDRWLAVAVWVAAIVAASLIADPTMNLFAMVLTSLPFVLTAWAVWIVVARGFSPPVQRVGFLLVLVVTIGYFTLLRWDGLRGDQTGQFSWRWTDSAEQQFLKSHHRRQSAPAGNDMAQAAVQNVWVLQPGDWAEFRGPARDGVIRGVRLATDWQEHPPREVWRKRVGPAWSSLIVVDGHVVTQEQRGENEAVVAYSAATGEEEWAREDKSTVL